ncbi:hypothetical protein FNF27_03376 [Cafeteria roenbergensis]|uniref:Ubiquitin-like domain-containing protein n=1 Tax=Cafeteria roenbergensis TaxID=33653 RepID=A0A5A8ECQ7_CAFRO|nr:hypothetical protein FNF27_03376 [Cafeteria roenbergensis]
MAATFLIRVRGKDGMWRVPGVSEATTIAEVKTLVQDLKGVEADTQTLSLDAKGDALADGDVLGDLGIGRGDILFIRYDGTAAKAAAPAPAAPGAGVVIAGGEIVGSKAADTGKAAFRPGMQAMRDIKRTWNWNEFMDLTRAHEFTVKQQAEAHCKKVSVDTEMMLSFVRYVQGKAFQTTRVAWLLGFFTEEGEAVAVAAYEPPQVASVDACELLEDPRAETVSALAQLLGMERVGMLYCHPPRHDPDRAFTVIAPEVVMAARAQAEAGPGSPFVTVKVTATETGEVSTEAFQVSDQGCVMVDKGAVSAAKPGQELPAAPAGAADAEAAPPEPAAAAAPAGTGVGRSISGRVGRSMSGKVSSAAAPGTGAAAAAAEGGTGRKEEEEEEEEEDGEDGAGAAAAAGGGGAASGAGAPSDAASAAAGAAAGAEAPSGPAMDAAHSLIVNAPFHCIVEAKPAAAIDVSFVLAHVPIGQSTYFLHSAFPRASRRAEAGEPAPGGGDLSRHLAAYSAPHGMEEALRDFELLLFLAEQPFLQGMMDTVADAVLDPRAPLDEGHKELIRAVATD